MQPRWFKDHLAYSMSKYGMSMCTLGMAAEFQGQVGVNSLWPKTTIATAAIAVHFPGEVFKASRKPTIMADAAYCILTSDGREHSGNFYIDETVLRQHGVREFDQYALNPGTALFSDLFLE
jgi:citronellol/citronellal dehydrogenase